MELLADLRERLPALSVLYLTSAAESTVIPEAQLPQHFQVLRAPFTIGELQTVVRRLLPQLQAGTVLALLVREPAATTDTPAPMPAKPTAARAKLRGRPECVADDRRLRGSVALRLIPKVNCRRLSIS
jgi:hypothetical protein